MLFKGTIGALKLQIGIILFYENQDHFGCYLSGQIKPDIADLLNDSLISD